MVAGTSAGIAPRLEIEHLSKTFGHTTALSDAHLQVEPGEIHALVGQNGSGKSTLIKVVAGYHTPDRGAMMRVDGSDVKLPVLPGSLTHAGVAIVHQDLGLIDHLTVSENINVGQEHPSRVIRRLDRRTEQTVAESLLRRLAASIDPKAPIGVLSAEQRTTVAIARALRSHAAGSGLIILDEATRALSHAAAASFHATLRRAVTEGCSVLLVAHSLTEVMAVADRVTVLRDGAVVGDGVPIGELTEDSLARLMLGRSLQQEKRSRPRIGGRPCVSVRGLCTSRGESLDFAIHEAEIVGLTGRTGSGWEEVPYLLAGVRRAVAGSVQVQSQAVDLTRSNVRRLLNLGVVLVPERRDVHGLAAGLSVAENISLPRIRSRGRPWFSGIRWQRNEVTEVVNNLDVRPREASMPVGQLSGGNQQKVLFGKWILGGPKLLILHEPTQGVDVSAREDLLDATMSAARTGTAVLLASSDFNDLSAICSRVLVVSNGAMAQELHSPEPDDIVSAVFAEVPPMGGDA